MKFTKTEWKQCLRELGFTERVNHQFGGMVVYNDKKIPQWTYETAEEQERLYIFFRGALYWKIHTMF